MIPVKIQCGCGQRYAFEVEVTGGSMAAPVLCPICGADGTAAANSVIAQSVAAQSAVAPSIRPDATVPEAPSQSAGLLPGQLERSQAEAEARAKVFWGDEPKEVIRFLMMHNVAREEAGALVAAMFLERTKAIRSTGVTRILGGVGMMCVPVVAYALFTRAGILPIKLFGITVAVGLWGAWRAMKGTIMFVAPKSEPGDVADK